ncbi:hypothetical protein L1987_03656 [Smallanthus sonchifolius]|uniref:Uncharacterized protein n=1 Tax=Smallanthus sonchifolius TaxID=185202 RepID=A0ACB9KB65_9ASTR|nr:hypothetical protein L1987_03656 [Smallanthus sonchifolius]
MRVPLSGCNLFLSLLTQSGLTNGFWRKCWCRAVDSFDYYLLTIGLESKHQLVFINLFDNIAINFGTNLLKLGHDEISQVQTTPSIEDNRCSLQKSERTKLYQFAVHGRVMHIKP